VKLSLFNLAAALSLLPCALSHVSADPRQPATSPTIEVIGPTTAPATSPNAPGAAPVLPKQVRTRAFGVRFSIPGDFVAGRFEPTRSHLLNGAVVFVETRLAQGIDVQRIPPGEVPVVIVMRLDAQDTRIYDAILDESWKTRIGPHQVYKLPGYPGPFGEEAHCYLMKRGDGGIVVYAHRMHPRDAAGERAPTHYDWVAEGIIATMEFRD
jgi:hypothetical protein